MPEFENPNQKPQQQQQEVIIQQTQMTPEYGGQMAPEYGGQMAPEYGGQMAPEYGGQLGPEFGGQLPPEYFETSTGTARVFHAYGSGQSKALGVIQVILGVVAMAFNSVAIYYEMDGHGDGLSYSGVGYWCGLWFMITGCLGVMAGVNKTTNTIMAFMIMSVFSLLALNLAFMGISAAGLNKAINHHCDFFGILKYDCGRENQGLLTMMACLLGTSIAEVFVVIWSIVVCSQVVCCATNQQDNQGRAEYHANERETPVYIQDRIAFSVSRPNVIQVGGADGANGYVPTPPSYTTGLGQQVSDHPPPGHKR